MSLFDDNKKIKVVRLSIILVSLVVVVSFVYNVATYVKLRDTLEHSIHTEQKKYVHLESRIDSVETLIKKIQKDTLFIEKIARENFGMVRKGEKVFKFKNIEEDEK